MKIQSYIEFFSKREQALQAIKKTHDSRYLFAHQVQTTGNAYYEFCLAEDFKEFLSFMEEEHDVPTYNEVIRPDRPGHVFFDLDIALQSKKTFKNDLEATEEVEINEKNIIDYFMLLWKYAWSELLYHTETKYNIDDYNHWVILTASTKEKISFHIINKSFIWTSSEEKLAFHKTMIHFMTQGNNEVESGLPSEWIDRSIYGEWRLFRMLNNVKVSKLKDKDSFLRWYSEPLNFEDSMVSPYKIQGEYISEIFPTISQVWEHLSPSTTRILQNNKKIVPTLYIEDYELVDGKNSDIYNKCECLIDIIGQHISLEDREQWVLIGLSLFNIFDDSTKDKSSALGLRLFTKLHKYYLQEINRESNRDPVKTWSTYKVSKGNKRGFLSLFNLAKECPTFEVYKDKYGSNPSTREKTKQECIHQGPFHQIELPFKADKTVHEKQLPSDFYIDLFNNIKADRIALAVKSGCGTGKTYNLRNLFTREPNATVLVIVYRITLGQDLLKTYDSLNFSYYRKEDSAIRKEFNTRTHPRLVVTMDSLHRVFGQYDYIVCDEWMSSVNHLFGGTIKDVPTTLRFLQEKLDASKRVIVLDANLTEELFPQVFKNHTIYKVENTYSNYDDVEATFLTDTSNQESILLNHVIEALKQDKRVVYCSNMKSLILSHVNTLMKMFPNKKFLTYTAAEQKTINTDDWAKLDCLMYSPTISAGVSFKPKTPYFHCLFGYFKNSRQTARIHQCLQQLFRVRELIDKKMLIYVDQDRPNRPFPLTQPDIETYIYDKARMAFKTYDQNAFIERDSLTGHLKKNSPYYLYENFIREENLSYLFFRSLLATLLKQYGMNITITEKEEVKDEIKEAIKDSKFELKEKDIDKLASAPLLNYEEADKLEKKLEKTPEEYLQWVKHDILQHYQVRSPQKIDFNAVVGKQNDVEITAKEFLFRIAKNNLYQKVEQLITLNTATLQIEDEEERNISRLISTQIAHEDNCQQQHLRKLFTTSDVLYKKEWDSKLSQLNTFALQNEALKEMVLQHDSKTDVTRLNTNLYFLRRMKAYQVLEKLGIKSLDDIDKQTKLTDPFSDEIFRNYIVAERKELSICFPTEWDFIFKKTNSSIQRYVNQMLLAIGLTTNCIDKKKKLYKVYTAIRQDHLQAFCALGDGTFD